MLQRTMTVIMLTVLAMVGLAGCRASTEVEPTATASTMVTADSPVLTHQGLAGIEFGEPRADLVREFGLQQANGDCAARLPDHPSVSPVFDAEDRLVLLWADSPVRTSEGIGVGSSVAEVQQAYPHSQQLRAPAGSHRFDGLLVSSDDRAYLFLHDGQQVQKLIAGYTDYVQLLFHSDFGTC